MNQKTVISIAIGIVIILWLLSGQSNETKFENNALKSGASADLDASRRIANVRGVESVAIARTVELSVRGRTAEYRKVQVRAEVPGRIVVLPKFKGERVVDGDVLCEIAVDTRDKSVIEAKAVRHQAALEYKGIKNLGKRGLQAETNVARSKATLASADAALDRALLQLSNTKIKSPFGGVLEEQPVEVGDYMRVGDVCALVLDTNPILLVGQVAEKDIDHITLGDDVRGHLITGENLTGKISYISQSADSVTRTYRIEVEVDNTEHKIRAGISSELLVPMGRQLAHHISPGILVLNDLGAMGVRIVNSEQRVEFHSVEVIAEGPGGVWIIGLPELVNIIVVGQETVFSGEQVKLNLTPLSSQLDSNPDQQQDSMNNKG